MSVVSEDLSIQDMLRMLDVARSLRENRESVDEQFAGAEAREQIRNRLLAAARASGDEVTSAEIDLAIAEYYDRLHSFQEPSLSISVGVAHLYVRRTKILAVLLTCLIAVGGLWLTIQFVWGWNRREVASLAKQIHANSAAINGLVHPQAADSIREKLTAWQRETPIYSGRQDVSGLRRVAAEQLVLMKQLENDYILEIVHEEGAATGMERVFTDDSGTRVSGYYLWVQPRGRDGKLVSQLIKDAETGREELVTRWAEQVPREVYERIADDKKLDGILHETVFAVKRRGEINDEVVIRGTGERPWKRQAQVLGQ